jgi:putative transposase
MANAAQNNQASYWRSDLAYQRSVLMPSEMKRLKLLEEENSRLKRLVADLSLDKAMLQDVLSRKL